MVRNSESRKGGALRNSGWIVQSLERKNRRVKYDPASHAISCGDPSLSLSKERGGRIFLLALYSN